MTYEEYLELKNSGRDFRQEMEQAVLDKLGERPPYPEWKSNMTQEEKDAYETANAVRSQYWRDENVIKSNSLNWQMLDFERHNLDRAGQLLANGDYVLYAVESRDGGIRVAQILDRDENKLKVLAPKQGKTVVCISGMYKVIKIEEELANKLIKGYNE